MLGITKGFAALCGDGIVSPFDRFYDKTDIVLVGCIIIAAALVTAAVLICIKVKKRRAAEERIKALMREEVRKSTESEREYE